ncbi:hypothetical protein NA57DRAFT_59502 [Rhizodiscina lignyota]|uniref:BZIP domain-containing protein n=1 Tax=Rhizodiscina lignyota TaxID=1504668 RepID=A0A9P4M5P0_9PEZI|nr:hypothetical protein NA57DRAFT_59502 [Rhizodiscina lignyota]
MSEQAPSAEGSGGGKRPRGRPLKSTVDEDESAIRRRARVRKAQQAFQKRKEAAVQSLEDRLGAVQNGLEEFSNLFSDFTTSITEAGIADSHPDILRQLHNLTERLLALANAASPQSPMDIDPAPGGPSGGGGSGGPSGSEDRGGPSGAQSRGRGSMSGAPGLGVEHLFLSDADPSGTPYTSADDQSGFPDSMQTMEMTLALQSVNASSVDPWSDAHAFSALWSSGTWYSEPTGLSSYLSGKPFSFIDTLFVNSLSIAFHDILRSDRNWSNPIAREKFQYCLNSRSRDELLLLVRLGSDAFLQRYSAGEPPEGLLGFFIRNTASLGHSVRTKMAEDGTHGDHLIDNQDMENYFREKGGFHFDSDTIRMSLPIPSKDSAEAITSSGDVDKKSPTAAKEAAEELLQTSQHSGSSSPNPARQGEMQSAQAAVIITLNCQALLTGLAAIGICTGSGVGYRKSRIDEAIVKSTVDMSIQ